MTRPAPTVWDQPDTACMPCRGRGWIIQEDPSGAPSTQVVCPYCRGRQTSWWVAPNRQKRIIRPRVRMLLILIWLTYSIFPSHHFVAHMLLLIPLVALLVLAWLKPHLWPSLSRREHAPGFTDAREGKALGIFAAVVGARSLFGNGKHRGF